MRLFLLNALVVAAVASTLQACSPDANLTSKLPNIPDCDGKNGVRADEDSSKASSDLMFLVNAYQIVLQRPADGAGLTNACKALREKTITRKAVLESMLVSEEFKKSK